MWCQKLWCAGAGAGAVVQELSCTFMPDQDKLLIGASATKWAGAQGNHLMGQVRTMMACAHELQHTV
jgi:hypothetical protein